MEIHLYPLCHPPKGTRLKFDIQSKGRDIDWEIPSTNLKKTGGIIYAILGKGKILQAEEIERSRSICPQYEFVLPTPLEAGESFTIVMGQRILQRKNMDTIRAQTTAQRRRSFLLYIDTTGKRQLDEPEIFTLDVRGGELAKSASSLLRLLLKISGLMSSSVLKMNLAI